MFISSKLMINKLLIVHSSHAIQPDLTSMLTVPVFVLREQCCVFNVIC